MIDTNAYVQFSTIMSLFFYSAFDIISTNVIVINERSIESSNKNHRSLLKFLIFLYSYGYSS